MSDIRIRNGKRGKRYQLRIPTGDPSRPYRYASFAKRSEAVAYQESLSEQRAAGRLTAPARPLGDAVDAWVEACELVGRHGREPVEASTLRNYRLHGRVLKELVVDGQALEHADIQDFDGPACTAIRDALLKARSRPYAIKVWASFKAMLAHAKDSGAIRANPAAGMMIVTSARHRKPKAELPTKEQMSALLKMAEAQLTRNEGDGGDEAVRRAWRRYYPMLLMRVFGGLRQSEVRAACWLDLDPDTGAFKVTQRADESNKIGTVKSGAGRRTIYLPPRVLAALKDWRKHCPISPGHLMFPTGEGKPESLGNLQRRMWVPLLKRAGLVDGAGRGLFAFNVCRHFYASLRIEQGLTAQEDPLVVAKRLQEAMGHSSIQVTMDTYGHLFPRGVAAQRAAAQALEDALLG